MRPRTEIIEMITTDADGCRTAMMDARDALMARHAQVERNAIAASYQAVCLDRDARLAELTAALPLQAADRDAVARTDAIHQSTVVGLRRDLDFATRGWRRWTVGLRRN